MIYNSSAADACQKLSALWIMAHLFGISFDAFVQSASF